MKTPAPEAKTLSRTDHLRILHWTRLGAIAEITKAEHDLATHVALALDGATADVVLHRFGYGADLPRAELIEGLRRDLANMRATLSEFLKIERDYMNADAERAGAGIAEAVLANRRAESKAAADSKVVGGAP